jgi:hypothetical protein
MTVCPYSEDIENNEYEWIDLKNMHAHLFWISNQKVQIYNRWNLATKNLQMEIKSLMILRTSDRKNSKCTILPVIVIKGKFPECWSQGLQVNIEFNSSFNYTKIIIEFF